MENEKFIKGLSDITSDISTTKKISWLIVSASAIGWIVLTFIYFQAIKERDKYIYVLTKDGQAISSNMTLIDNTRHLEAEALTRMFIQNFYEVSPASLDEKMKQAMLFGNSAVKDLYIRFENDPKGDWWKRLKELSISQKVLIEYIKATKSTTPFIVESQFKCIISQENKKDAIFDIIIVLTLRDIKQRTETNPFGIEIENITTTKFEQI